MNSPRDALLCWHAERAGLVVLESALRALRNRKVDIASVLYLVQAGRHGKWPEQVEGVALDVHEIPLTDPTQHSEIYQQIQERVLPRLRSLGGILHVNVSPGTPAMHSVWLILHAGGAFPEGTRLWSSQLNQETRRTRIDPVEFPISTYLAEVRQQARVDPAVAVYEPEARSPARRAAFEALSRYAKVLGAPLLILGERGIGKTRLVETLVAALKGRRKVVTVPCGGLDSALAESVLFGHRRGAFTGAAADRPGLLAEADGGILFLDEVQDLPQSAQRKLVRVFQDRQRRYRPVGSDREEQVDVELVCASNLSVDRLRRRLDADLFDRLSHLTVVVPSLSSCREDLREDWERVWREQRQLAELPAQAPWSAELAAALGSHPLPGNLRDLQRLAVLVMAWWNVGEGGEGLRRALQDWAHGTSQFAKDVPRFGSGSRSERIDWFRARLARWAKRQFGTWKAAGDALRCDQKTLRDDAGHSRTGDDNAG